MKNNPDTIRQQLEHRILRGLACEWESALSAVSSEYRAAMKKPLFSLGDLKHTWGYWSADKGEICLSRRLVLNHPWDAVTEVLLHELAHQFAHEVLAAGNEPAHGPAFLEACAILRANPKASGTYPLLHETLQRGVVDENDKILVRIRKLLALAESRNRHEAEAAMIKAHELVSKYNVDLLALDRRRDFFSMFLGEPALRHPRDAYHLAHLIQDFYYVQGIWVQAYVVGKGKMGRVLEVSGTRQNLTLAGYVYDFVCRYIQSQWTSYNRNKGLHQHRRTDYAVGVIEGFREKLDARKNKPITGDGRLDLTLVSDRQLVTYMKRRYPHTRSFRRNASRQDQSVLRDGKKAGRALVLHRGISERRNGAIRLIRAPGDG